MRRIFIALLLSTATLAASAQETNLRRGNNDWSIINGISGCVGGSTCPNKSLRVPLEDRPVLAIRFHAHDQIGTKAEGVLRVKIDGNVVESYIDVPRKGEVFTIDVEELRGRNVVFEAANNDEVEITDVAVLYAAATPRRVIPRDRDRDDRARDGDWPRNRGGGGSGWREYPRAATCIGGTDCRKNGNRITIALENAPVLGVRFFAHDAIGQRADGRLAVRIDDKAINSYIDIRRDGKVHELDVDSIYGSKLVIETANDDEVDIKDIEVLYGRREGGRRGNGGGRYESEVMHEGGCIGGTECGGRRARIRIPLHGRAVESLRFYARDDVGTRAGGELHIRIDDEVLEYAMDIPREGRTFTIDGKSIAGEYLIIEPAEDDEVVLKDVRVRFRDFDDD